MADGLLGKCKLCSKKDVRERYYSRDGFLKISEYEKFRNKTKHRKYKKSLYEKKRRLIYPNKYKAWKYINNAVRDGRIEKQPCKICGSEKSQAHHADYRKPKDVKWLCFYHHRLEHGQLKHINYSGVK